MSSAPSRFLSPLVIVILIAVLLRFGSAIFAAFFVGDISFREGQHLFAAYAENLLAGNGIASRDGTPSSFLPPGYAFFLALIWAPFGKSYSLVWFAQASLGVGVVVITYRLGKEAYGEKVGQVAAALIAVYPSLILYTHFDDVAILYTFVSLLAISLVALALKRGSSLWAALSGIFFGLAVLSRQEWLPAVIILAVALPLSFRRWPWTKSAILLGAFLIVISPWMARNSLLYGKPVIAIATNSGYNMFVYNNPSSTLVHSWESEELKGEFAPTTLLQNLAGSDEYERHTKGMRYALDFMIHHPLLTLFRGINRLADFWMPERLFLAFYSQGYYKSSLPTAFAIATGTLIFSSYVLILFTAIPGLLAVTLNTLSRILLFFLLWTMVIAFVSFAHPRFHIPLIPILSIFSAYFLVNFTEAKRKLLNSTKLKLALTLMCSLVVAIWIRELLFGDLYRISVIFR